MVPTAEGFNLPDSDNDREVSRYEYVEPFLRKAELCLRIEASMELGWHVLDRYEGYKNGIKKKRFAKSRF